MSILHLRPEEDELLSGDRLRAILRKYSDHITVPILMKKETWDTAAKKQIVTDADEQVNQASALWARSKSEITEEQYHEFYKHVAHDFESPLAYVHAKVEGRQEYTQLFYIPQRAPFDLWDREHRRGIKLYVRRVFIMDDAEDLMPAYLRFVRGIIDSSDLPLNVSREILQQSRDVQSIRAASIKRVLGLLEDLASHQPEKYATFWQTFGRVLKEGAAEDMANRDRLAKLLRFASTHDGSEAQTVSLADYVGRMKEGQDAIYYITADGFAAARNSPHLEIFRKLGVEVLLMYDRIDEWVVSTLTDFEGKPLQSVAKGDLDLSKLKGDAAKDDETSDRRGPQAADRAHAVGAEGSGQRGTEHRAPHRFAGVPRRRRTWPQHESRAHPEGGGAECAGLEASAGDQPESPDRPASEGRERRDAVCRLESHPVRPGHSGRRRAARGSGKLRQAAQRADAGARRRRQARGQRHSMNAPARRTAATRPLDRCVDRRILSIA